MIVKSGTIQPLLVPVSAALLVLLYCLSATAGDKQDPVSELSGFWTVRFEQKPSNAAVIDLLPEEAIFIDDAGAGELGLNDFAGLKLSEQGKREIEQYNYHDELKTENTCVDPSVVFYMQSPFPMEINHGRDMIVFNMEYFDMVRIIFMDGRGHPSADAPHTKSGHSIGHWDGDDLIVDTTHIASGTIMNNGLTHSDNIHMLERFRLSKDSNTLWLTQLYDDAEVFSGIGARYMAWRKVPGEHIYPYECDPSYGE